MTRTIIASARGEAAKDSLALAIVLARMLDARVLIAGVYVLPIGLYARSYEDAVCEETRRELAALSADVPAGIDHDFVVKAATSPGAGLHDLAEETGALAVVLGASHFGAVGRALAGDIATPMLRDAPCAIAVAPAGYAKRRAGTPSVVGVAWDTGEEVEAALRAAVVIADRAGAQLRLIHVLPDLPASVDLPFAYDPAFLRSRREIAANQLADAATHSGATPVPETLVLEGSPAHELAVASREVDLLVAGSRAYGPLRRAILGSVTTALLHHSTSPLLILPRGRDLPVGEQA